MRRDDIDAYRRDSRDDEEVERGARYASHLPMVDQEVLAYRLCGDLEKYAADHAERKEREAVEDLPAGETEKS